MITFREIAVLLLVPSAAVLGSPVGVSLSATDATCEQLSQRRPWHTLSNDEKLEYLNAELCLMSLDSTSDLLTVSRTQFDTLQENHQVQAELVHGVGAFLPYHRYLMWAHEYLLRTECGYTGSQPYWYEQQDAGHVLNSTILDPVYGFGGNGRASDGCITDGPFANYTNVLGPGHNNTVHCINRDISNMASLRSGQSYVDACNQYNTYEEAWPCIEDAPHSGGHGGIGGQMANPISSPGDPTFYLHHTWLDKVWWDWQALNLSSRLYDISGRNVQDPNEGFPELGGPDKRDMYRESTVVKRDGDPGNVTTLNHVLNMYGIVPNATIEQVMDIRADFLCYEYVEP